MKVWQMAFAIAILPITWSSSASAIEFKAEKLVDSTGVNCPGEKYKCGEGCVRCDTVDLIIPANYKLQDYRVEVRDDQNGWTTEATNIGWCAWEEQAVNAADGGGVRIRATLRNWSHNRPRSVRIIANAQ